MKRLLRFVLISVAAVAANFNSASPALACDRSPDLMRIPGSTDAEAEARYKSYEHARDVIWALELEKAAIEKSWTVYLAKVEVVAAPSPKSDPRTVTLKPVWQVRGLLPDKAATIQEDPLTSCPFPGGLYGSKVGELVVVFESPGSTSGWPAAEVRSGELIDAIDMYAVSLERKSQQRR